MKIEEQNDSQAKENNQIMEETYLAHTLLEMKTNQYGKDKGKGKIRMTPIHKKKLIQSQYVQASSGG